MRPGTSRFTLALALALAFTSFALCALLAACGDDVTAAFADVTANGAADIAHVDDAEEVDDVDDADERGDSADFHDVDGRALDIAAGRELFLHAWTRNDERARGGDGLGPLYNATSCAACHSQGGVGGAGGEHHNVVIGDGRVFHRHGGGPVPSVSGIGVSIFGPQDSARGVGNLFGPGGLGSGVNNSLGGLSGGPVGGSGGIGIGIGGLGTGGGLGIVDNTSGVASSVRFGAFSVIGGFDKALAERVVKRAQSQLRYCYERELVKNTALASGSVDVHWVVRSTGAVARASITKTTLKNEPVEKCLTSVFSRLKFPASDKAGDAIVTTSITFVTTRRAAPPPPPPPTVVVQRNTPALFGVGLVDDIPDEVIEANAAMSIAGHPEISGKIGRTPEGRVTRFGWKGDVPDLITFVARACSIELGLEVPGSPQPGRRKTVPGLDIDLDDLENLVAFVKALPKPVENRNAIASEGAELFDEIGCTGCHTPALGDVDGLYSDLLLHDMGTELDDNANVGYYGSPPVGGSNEWRTPPLWGVRDSAPYLHDGRARTLERAIALHGGEAWRTRQSFNALTDDEQAAVVAFLESLQAPN